VLAADGRFTDDELEAYLDAIGRRLDPPLRISSMELRGTDLLTRHADSIRTPGALFDLFARADARDASTHAATLYRATIDLVHVAGALDRSPSLDEVAAIDTLRDVMLGHLDHLGVPRPGAPRPGAADGGPAPGGSDRPARSAEPATTAGGPAVPDLAPAPRPLVELLAELDELVGLDVVKADIHQLASLARIRALRARHDLPNVESGNHLVFAGNPGTGKTTVARLYSQILRAVEVVSNGQLVETDRSQLVAGYVGQTATRTRAVLERAVGGTLLVDEAYALARGGEDDFGREAIDTIVKFMEDHRDDLAVIAAGYSEEMAEFIGANPGLDSRFARTVTFPDYDDDQLVEIFTRIGTRSRYSCDAAALDRLREIIADAPRGRGFGNARYVRNLFETAIARHARRLAAVIDGGGPEPDATALTMLTADDLAPLAGLPGVRSPSDGVA
jgi:hypothetical protein